ncbi:MAG: hypothetical protein M3083_24955 [Actinomycetota bacterium]|nr:hypothetical protein [Actinomycetota bacterium]
MRRSLSVLACLVAVALFGASSAAADTAQLRFGHTNVVQAVNSNSAAPVVRTGTALGFDQNGAAVTDGNIAFAHSFDCTGCRTVAVAIQVVVVQGSPSSFQPENGAAAVNDNCHSCQTFAYAHQYVIQITRIPEGFNPGEGTVEQVGTILSNISQVAHSNEDFVTMSSQLDQLSLELYNTVSQALQSQNHGDGGHKADEHRQAQEKD